MKIRNFCFGLRNKQINYYLNNLPDIYRTCEVPVLLINRNILGYLIFLFYNWKYDLNDRSYKGFLTTGGSSYHRRITHEPTFIYCAMGRYVGANVFMVFTIFHELRHWYQQKHLRDFHIKHSMSYSNDTSLAEYDKQPLEKDANDFARKHSLKVGIRFIKVKGVDYISMKRSKLKI